MAAPLDESDLDEKTGVCGRRIDWNEDGVFEAGVSRDLNGDNDSTDAYRDYANWPNLLYGGPKDDGDHGN